jgi:hypothetical protein
MLWLLYRAIYAVVLLTKLLPRGQLCLTAMNMLYALNVGREMASPSSEQMSEIVKLSRGAYGNASDIYLVAQLCYLMTATDAQEMIDNLKREQPTGKPATN